MISQYMLAIITKPINLHITMRHHSARPDFICWQCNACVNTNRTLYHQNR